MEYSKSNFELESCEKCISNIKIPWYKEKIYIVTVVTSILLVLSYIIKQLNPFFFAFIDYISTIWWAIIVGFIIGGIIDYFVPREYIKKYFSVHRKRTVVYSVIFGFLMSACSHGILAIAIELYRKGANTSSVISFLLASPWANLPITFILIGFFGWKAFLIISSALLIAIITGLIYQTLEKKGLVECNICEQDGDDLKFRDVSIKKDICRRLKQFEISGRNVKIAIVGVLRGAWTLSKMVMWWLFIGMIIAAFARAYISHDLFMNYMGPTFFGLLVTLLFATIIEVCSEGSSPLAFEIYNQTGAFGNSLTFLMAGVATDYTEVGLIWHNIGKRAAIWLPVLTVPQILMYGILFNIFIS